jgi:hypothetical protein
MTTRKRRKKRVFFQQVQRLNCGRRRDLDEDERFGKALDYDDEDYDWEAYGPIVGRASSSASDSTDDSASQHSRVRHTSSRLIEGFEAKLLRSFRRQSSSAAAPAASRGTSADCAPGRLQLHVKVPLGLEPGNSLIVVLPHEEYLPALKVPMKVPAGLKAGDEFVVPDDFIRAALNHDDDDEGSLSSLVETIVENPPCSPSQPIKQRQQNSKPSWTTGTQSETRQDSVVDMSAFWDDFFTPTPEVQGYYRRTPY